MTPDDDEIELRLRIDEDRIQACIDMANDLSQLKPEERAAVILDRVFTDLLFLAGDVAEPRSLIPAMRRMLSVIVTFIERFESTTTPRH